MITNDNVRILKHINLILNDGYNGNIFCTPDGQKWIHAVNLHAESLQVLPEKYRNKLQFLIRFKNSNFSDLPDLYRDLLTRGIEEMLKEVRK